MASSTLVQRSEVVSTAIQLERREADPHWRSLYRTAAWASALMLTLIPAAVAAFIIWPPPFGEGAEAWFTLYQDNWLLGLMGLDLLFLLSNVLMLPLYLALYAALRRVNASLMALTLAMGLVSLASYLSSNTAFQMLLLSNRYEAATTDAERTVLIAAGESMLATFQGTAFNVYYVLGAIALILIAYVMFQSVIFSRTTAWVALIAGLSMIVPSTAGSVGLVFSLLSLVPWVVFLVLISRRFLQMSRE